MKKGNPNYFGNQNAAKYKTQEQFQKVIDKYFSDCDKKDKPYTMSGLALALDIDRSTLVRYGEKDLFASQVKKAKQKVEQQLEENALLGKGNSTFTIFNLKNNYNWRDNVEVTNNDQLAKVQELLTKLNEEANK